MERLPKIKKSSSRDFAYAMVPLKILSWPVGTWPLQQLNLSSILRSIIALSLVLSMLMVLQTEVYLDHSDAEKNLSALALTACGILAVSKVTCFRVYSDDLVTNFVSAVNDYNQLTGEEKRAIMRQHAYMGRVASASLIFFSYVASTLYMTMPILAGDNERSQKDANATKEEKLEYPIPSEHTMEILRVPENLYPLIFVMEYAMLLATSTGNLGSDSLFLGIAFHLCGQAEVLKLDFSKFVDDCQNRTKRFNVLTMRHQHLLKLFDKLNNVISFILAIQLFASCLLLCTTGVELILSLSVHTIVLVVKSFIAMTFLAQMFAYSYMGEYLKNQMESIGYSAYCSSWYNVPTSLSKDVIFILQRTQIPVQLMAGKLLVVNMETYMSIVRTSMSYLSVLRVMINT